VELLRAIFEAKLQRWEDALWDYAVALNLEPELARFSFRDYPSIAPVFLAERECLLKQAEERKQTKEECYDQPAPEEGSAREQQLKRISFRQPEYPKGARKDRRERKVSVVVTLDECGAPRDLFWHQDCDNAPFYLAAAEAIRHWRYELPEEARQKKAALVCITLNFLLSPGEGCPRPVRGASR
jgi:hypothetical protein